MTDTFSPEGADACARPAPPVGRRFPPGRSGNPAGGPKRPAPRTAEVEWLFSQSFTVEIDGERQHLPLAKALLLSLAHRALKGDARAATELLALYGKAEDTRAAQAADKARKAAEKAEREVENPPRPTIRFVSSQIEDGLRAIGVLKPDVRDISRWAFETLTAADPGLITGLTEMGRRGLRDYLCKEEWPEGPPSWMGEAYGWPKPPMAAAAGP